MVNYLNRLHQFSRDVRLFLIASAVLGFAFFGIYTLLLNLYLLRLGYGPEFVGLVNAAGSLAFAICSLPAGALSRRWGSRRVLMASFSFMLVGSGLLPLAEFMPPAWQKGWLLATYMLTWLGGSLYVVNINPFLMDGTSLQERDHAFSAHAAIIPVAGFAGNLVGGLLPGLFAAILDVSLEQPQPYRYPLWIAAALYLLAVLCMRATRAIRVEHGQHRVLETGVAPYSLIVVIALVMLLRVAGEWVMRIFFNVYLDDSLHVSPALIGTLLAVGQLFGAAALTAPLMVARWGQERTITWGTLGMGLSVLPLVFIAHWAVVGLGFMVLIGLASLTNPPLAIFSQEIVAPRWRTTIAGAMTMALGVGIAVVGFGGGYLITALGYRMLFLVGAGLNIAAAVLFFAYFHIRGKALARRHGLEATAEVS